MHFVAPCHPHLQIHNWRSQMRTSALMAIVFAFVSLISLDSLGSLSAGEPVRVYRGTWQSQSTGHSGPMRVRVTPNGNGEYTARFTGRFAVIIPFTYRARLNTVGCTNCGTEVNSHKQLGPLLGSYDMSANMSSSSFQGSFQAAGDSGRIQMSRVR